MPNKYSHAFVLSSYQAHGFISLPDQSLPSYNSPQYNPSISSTENTATPPLTAVPALSSDSSTTSTASSLDDPPTRPQHSASCSSIVTEIYAPQSQYIETIDTSEKPPVQQQVKEEPSSHDPSNQEPPPEQPPLPLPSTSRFSSLHNFSPFLNPSQLSKRHKKRSQKQHHNPPPKEDHQPYQTSSSKPIPSQPPPPIQHPKPRSHTPYKRLEPVFDTDSLASLSLTGEKADLQSPPSPNMSVLPWEYPPPSPIKLDTYLPRGHPGTHPEANSNIFRDIRWNPNTAPSTMLIPTRRSSTSHRSPEPQTPFYTYTPANDVDIDADPAIFLHDSAGHYDPPSRSSSFDSVAPPPIRIGPRDSFTVQRARSKREKERRFSAGIGWLGGGGR
ncbi:MAG: hypothetical protein Q9225_003398 [Loekoesia sp. 1 TL-2023]